jgi:hypothetical protein
MINEESCCAIAMVAEVIWKTAKQIGVTIPQSVLYRADRLIR